MTVYGNCIGFMDWVLSEWFLLLSSYLSCLWLVGNEGMGYNYNYYYYHSSIPY